MTAELRDRGEAYDKWAPRLLHEPLLAGMKAAADSIFGNPDHRTRRTVGAYLGAVNRDALVDAVLAGTGAVGELTHARARATVDAVLELLTPPAAR